jgi:hypothetical protein
MTHKIFILLTVMIGAGCAGYLLCNSMELENFFITRWLSSRCFPNLDPVRRHQRMQMICGLILAVIVIVFAVIFVIKRMNHR